MNFDLDENQALFKATLERFAGSGDAAVWRAAHAHPGAVDPARWAELASLGILGLAAAEADDGLGGSTFDCAVVAEALGRGMVPEPWLEAAYFPLRLLDGCGGDLAARIADGSGRVAVAFAEPGQRYITDPRTTRATGGDDGWTLSGRKTFVLAGEAAETWLVTALTDDGPALFAVDASAVPAQAYTVADGGRAVDFALYDVPARHLGRPDIGRAVAETRLMASAEMLGLAQKLFDETLAYVRERRQFGQPIGRFQAVQHRLVDAYARLEQMRSMMWRTAMAETLDNVNIAGCKAFVADGALAIGHEAIQLHGGMGVTDELAIGHAHKRVLLLSKLFGDPAHDLLFFAEAA